MNTAQPASLPPGVCRIGRDQPIDQRFHRAPFLGGEIGPGAWLDRAGRRSGIRLPGQRSLDRPGSRGRRQQQGGGRGGEEIAATKAGGGAGHGGNFRRAPLANAG